MSKSRGTGIVPLRYLAARHEPRMAALLHRGQAQRQGRGHRLQPRRLRRARQQRPDRQVRQHRQPRGGLPGQALRRPAVRPTSASRAARCSTACARPAARCASCTRSASSARRCARSCCWPTASTSTSTGTSPGSWPRSRAWTPPLHDVCSDVHRGFPRADDLPQAGAAGAGGAGRGLPERARRWTGTDAARALGAAHASATTST